MGGGGGAGVVDAAALLGPHPPRPTEQVVCPATVTVDVVNETLGTVTVVTRCVVILLPEQVNPADTPVL